MAAPAKSFDVSMGHREVLDLRKVSARDLEPLLEDEVREWRRQLNWDFSPTADLVRQYTGTNSLGGAALTVDGALVGYGYAVVEEPRGIIGDIYIRPRYRSAALETELFRSLLDALSTTPRILRMESQLMLTTPASAAAIRDAIRVRDKQITLFERLLLSRQNTLPLWPANPAVQNRFRFEPWHDRQLHAASVIIAAAYQGTTDSIINSQYQSQAGARVFLGNIVEFPGCGNFHRAASSLAFDTQTGKPVGIVLTTMVSADTGHIAQLCVLPEARGTGLGRELLRTACAELYRRGATRVSLTVTATNRAAVTLYATAGFHNIRNFSAYIWEA